MSEDAHAVRLATVSDAVVVARLLDAFNREFDTPSPGTQVLAARLRHLIAADHLAVVLSGEPAIGVAVLSFRPNVWFDGPVATLDELYVRPDQRGNRFGHDMLEAACRLAGQRGAQTIDISVYGINTGARRFYEAHGFANTGSSATGPIYSYHRDLGSSAGRVPREQQGTIDSGCA